MKNRSLLSHSVHRERLTILRFHWLLFTECELISGIVHKSQYVQIWMLVVRSSYTVLYVMYCPTLYILSVIWPISYYQIVLAGSIVPHSVMSKMICIIHSTVPEYIQLVNDTLQCWLILSGESLLSYAVHTSPQFIFANRLNFTMANIGT